MDISIKFFKTNKNKFTKPLNLDLFNILKLCLLKEIALTDDFDDIKDLPEDLYNIMILLRKGTIIVNNNREEVVNIFKKIEGGNIINLSRYIDKLFLIQI